MTSKMYNMIGIGLSFVIILLNQRLASTLYSASSPIKILKSDAFEKSVKAGNVAHLVEFFAPWCGHCKAFVPEYEKAAKALQGIIRVVAVEDEAVMKNEGVQGFPTIKLYFGNHEKPISYEGARTADGLVTFVITQFSARANKRLGSKKADQDNFSSRSKKNHVDSSVIELSESTFDKLVLKDASSVWFVEFFAPWCGHCKALAPKWEHVATALKGKVKVGKVDATTQTALAQRFKIQGFPTLLIFPSGQKSTTSAIPYNGPREEEDMIKFATEFALETIKVEQLTSNERFIDECQKTVCILAFLPDLLDSKATGRNKYLSQLNKVARASATAPIKFFWLQGGDSYDFEEALHLQFGYPAVVAIHLDKKKFGIHKGHFTDDALTSFVLGLTSGRERFSTIPANLPLLTKVEIWDGKEPKQINKDSNEKDNDEL